MKNSDAMPETPAPTDAGLTESLVFGVIVVVFLICCVAAWWLVQRAGVPGAPGAPIG